MADIERNQPVQDPENLENEIKESAVNAEEPVAYEAETPAEEILEEEAAPEEISVEAVPVEEDTVEEAPGEELPSEDIPEENISEEETCVEEASVEEAPVDEQDPIEEEQNVEEEDAANDSEDKVFGRLEFEIGKDGEFLLKSTGDADGNFWGDDKDEEERIDPEDLVIYDDVVDAIKAEGARLTNNDLSILSYDKNVRDAIRGFEQALKSGQKALDANRDENETTAIIVGIIKICGKMLEIKSNALENYVRVQAFDHVKDARVSLHNEIERYNEWVITYSSVTGEQLTRLSTFLPENIAAGKSLAVIPQLSYIERYVQILPDEVLTKEERVTTMKLTPAVTADSLLTDTKPPQTKFGCWVYSNKVKRLNRKISSQRAKINKQIAEVKASRKRYEIELKGLESRSTVAERATEEYKNKVFAIRIKYGKKLSGIKTIRAASAFARTRQRLAIDRMALEREKLVLAYEYLRAVNRAGSYSQRKVAERLFGKAMLSYNQCAELTTKQTGTAFDLLPTALLEQVRRGAEITFPVIVYKRDLFETVGGHARKISMAVAEDIAPDEQSYSEHSSKILEKQGRIKNTATLSEESTMVDRASAIAKIMIESLNESADMVVTADDYDQFVAKSNRAIKHFKRAKKGTEKAISRAFDENGVVTALVENLRVIASLIEVTRIKISVDTRLNRPDAARKHSKELYKLIELYNGRAIDYMSIVGEQFSRISTVPTKELVDSADELKVPTITYKDNYIEVFPKDPLQDSTYEKPRQWRSGVYTPLLMHHYRLTENRAVETTVINAPFVFDVTSDELPAVSWWHPIGFWQHLIVCTQPIAAWWSRMYLNAEIWFVDESLLFSKMGVDDRQIKNDKKKEMFERKLKKLNEERNAKILALETVVAERDRQDTAYQKKLYSINAKFSRKIYNLKLRWMRECTGRNGARLLLERLVIERERLAGMNKVLAKYRSYGRITFTPNVIVRYKKKFVEAINAHNKTARLLSEMMGVKFSEVSTTVADDVIRYGKIIKFPEIVCCREVIETIDGQERTVGDKWHGYGLYTGTAGAKNTGSAPVMSVGAMGYATNMGVPYLKADFDGLTMIGMTPGGVPLIGFGKSGEATIPFTGTPMMLAGTDHSATLDAGMFNQDPLILGAASVNDPYSGVNRRGVNANYTNDAEEDAKDARFGCSVETPLDLESKMIEERFRRSLRARSMTSVDGVSNWWKLIGSEINIRLMRKLALRPKGFLRCLLPPVDEFVEIVNNKITPTDASALQHIARVGGIIEIECKRLYSATKTGVRRSQRIWSAWLHEDIQYYNKLVKEYNSGRERYMHIEPLSLNIPDTIVFRNTDRPPTPPVFTLRNRVKLDEEKPSVATDEIYDKLIEYAKSGAIRHATPFGQLWSKLVIIPLIEFHYKHGHHGRVLSIVNGVILRRSTRTYLRRQDNENRHYRIRYEKARAMKRYNKEALRAVGVASNPIKYQSRSHKVLRDYMATNFRIDYNMRIRQLIYRALRIDFSFYWIVTLALATVLGVVAVFAPSSPILQTITFAAVVWSALPIALLLLRIVYDIVMLIASNVLLFTRNIWLIKYGARDVERNRYGAILDCFVSEQYRLLLACEKLRRKPKSITAKKMLIASANDYNKRAEGYSEILRVPIKSVEITSLIDKLISGESYELTEIQNFVYARELVERVDSHEVGKTLSERELGSLVEEINRIINGINLVGADDQESVDALQSAMTKLVGYVQSDIKPSQTERYELKRDLTRAIEKFDIGVGKQETFAHNVITVVDQLGGRDSRRIIGILAEDDMIN